MTNKYYPWIVAGLASVFVFIGNDIFTPPSFDLSLGSMALKTILAVAGMLVLPLIAIRFLFKKNWREFGFKKPDDTKQALKLTGLFIGVNLPILGWLAGQAEFQFNYRLLDTSFSFFILSAGLASFIYFLTEEFLFRGFLFLGLLEQTGSKSYWVTSLIFTAFHFSKGYTEIIYSFFISWWLCWLAQKTKSFLPAALAHFALALVLNILINYNYILPMRIFAP